MDNMSLLMLSKNAGLQAKFRIQNYNIFKKNVVQLEFLYLIDL